MAGPLRIEFKEIYVAKNKHDYFYKIPRNQGSGRIVCVTGGMSEKQLLSPGKYKLSQNNRLLEAKTKQEYTASSYFVLQIDSKANKKLEGFDYYLGAADLFKKTNRGGNPAEIVSTVAEMFKGYRDITAIEEIEDLSIDAADEETHQLRLLH